MTDWPQLVETHGPAVWSTIYRMVNNMEAARDCYQETFLAALRESQRRPIDNWAGFLKTVATRRAIDHLRRRYRHRDLFRPLTDLDQPTQRSCAVDQSMRDEQLSDELRRALATLAPRQSQAFCLRYMEDMSLGEIAARLGTPSGNVSVLINRARSRLRDALAQSGNTISFCEVRP